MIVKVQTKGKGKEKEEEFKAVFFNRNELIEDFNATVNEIETQMENIKLQMDILRELTKWINIVE